MKQIIPGKSAAALSIGVVLAFVIYNMVITAANLAPDPWYHSSLFSIGGSLFALAALISGSMALRVGRGALPSRDRQFAAIGIVAGLSYLAYIGLMYSRA